ncbi:MAG: hypothetical protein ACR2NZ_21525, partial [Rubripirellula sp.]
MNRPRFASIEHTFPRIEGCERRLALSASIAADLLLQALGDSGVNSEPTGQSPEPTETESEPDDLLSQAAAVRDSAGLDGSGQTVAVIDSGVAWDHVSLGGGYGPGYRVVGGWDF